MDEIRTILVTTDFSETSQKAFPLARGLAEKYGAKLILTYVDDDRLPPLVLEYTEVDLTDVIKHQQERALRRLERLAEEQLGAATRAELKVTSGNAHVEIVRLAEELKADLIVMATHGRGFISHAFLGSTTERVVRRAPCPVLVVRDPGAREGNE